MISYRCQQPVYGCRAGTESKFTLETPWVFSRKFTPAQAQYSTYDRELMAIVEAIKYFLHEVEGRPFQVCTDHKPIVYSQNLPHDKAPSHRTRRISYLSEFDIVYSHVKGEENPVPDALSRIDSISDTRSRFDSGIIRLSQIGNSIFAPEILEICETHPGICEILFPSIIDEETLRKEQNKDPQLTKILEDPYHPLKLQKLTIGPKRLTVYCEIREECIRVYVPSSLRKEIMKLYHKQSHPVTRVTDGLIRQNYVWPFISRDIAAYCRTCLKCQTSKISRNNETSRRNSTFSARSCRYCWTFAHKQWI